MEKLHELYGKNCKNLTKPFYTILEAAICLCGQEEKESEITDKVLNGYVFCGTFSWWPDLEKTIEFLNTAIKHGLLHYQEHCYYKRDPHYHRTMLSSDIKNCIHHLLDLPSENSLLLFIAKSMKAILGTSPGGVKNSVFINQAAFTDYLAENNQGHRGFSKRNLDEIVAKANQALAETSNKSLTSS